MAYYIDTSNADAGNTTSSDFTISYPSKSKVGDLLVLRVTTHLNTVDDYVTPSGWTKVGTTQSIGSTTMGALYYRIHDGGTEVTVQATANTFRWGLMLTAFRDVDQTTPIATSSEYQESGTKITFPSVTPTSKNDLYVANVFSRSSILESKSDCSGNYPFELIGVDGFRWSRSIMFNFITGIDNLNPTNSDIQLQTNNYDKGSTVLIIKNSVGGRTTPPLYINYTIDRKFGDFCVDNANEVNETWLDGSGVVTSIDGSPVITESNTSNAGNGNQYSSNYNPTSSTNGTQFNPTSLNEGEWSVWYQSISLDLTDKVLRADFCESNQGRAKEIGLILIDSLNNWSVYTVLNSARLNVSEGFTLNISKNTAPRHISTTPPDLSVITKIGTVSRLGTNTSDGHFLVGIKTIESIHILGGTPEYPSTSQGISHLSNSYLLRNSIQFQGLGQLVSRVPITIGDGVREVVYDGSDKSLEFVNTDGVSLLQDTQDLSFKINTSSTDIITSNSINGSEGGTKYDLTNSNVSSTYSFDGTTVSCMSPTLNPNIPINSQKFSVCDMINGGSGTYTNLIIENSKSITSAMLLSSGASLIGSTFTKGIENYAIELDSSGLYDLSNTTFSGYTIILNITATTGTVTIQLGEGQSEFNYISSGATVVFNVPSKSITLTGLKPNSEVRVYESGTINEIGGIELSSNSFSQIITQDIVDVVIFHLQYKPIKMINIDTTNTITLPINQILDRSFRNI